MKNNKRILLLFVLILGLFVIYPIKVNADENFDIEGFINNTKIFSNITNINNVRSLSSGNEVALRINLRILGDAILASTNNPQGVNYYLVLNVCTTEGSAFEGNIGTYNLPTGSYTLIDDYGRSGPSSSTCTVGGFAGNIVARTIVFSVNKTTYNVDGDFFEATGDFYFAGGRYTTYNNLIQIVGLKVYRQDSSSFIEYEGNKIIKESVKTSNNILTNIINLPTNLWNFMKQIPGQVWNFFSSAFDLVVDGISNIGGFIIDLPGHIWNGIKAGFNWIVDGISNLFDFFSKDDDVDVSGLSSIGLLPAGAVDSILNLPFTFLDNLNNNLNKQCQAVNIPLPYVNKNLPLPCVNTIFTQISGLSGFISGISVILASLILFKYLINLYKWVDKTLSLKDNNHLDSWGGL